MSSSASPEHPPAGQSARTFRSLLGGLSVFGTKERIRLVIVPVIALFIIVVTIFAHAPTRSGGSVSGAPKDVLPQRIEVEVVNGTGESRLAMRFTEMLRANGFDVVDMNTSSSPVQKSVVIDRTGSIEPAKKIAAALRFPKDRVLQKPDKSLMLDVSVVIGADYSSLHLLQE